MIKGELGWYQQGDVKLFKIKEVKSGFEKQKSISPLVIAFGSATGHSHRFENAEKIDLYKNGESVIIEIKEPSEFLVHDEHHKTKVDAGIYEIEIVPEYDHFEEEVREVQD